MKKTCFGLLIAFVLTVVGFGQDVQIKDQKAFFYAYLECTGPYSQIQAKIGEFMQAYMSQGLGSFSGLMALYFNAPGQVPEAQLKWRIGSPIGKDAEPAAPLKKDVFDYPKVAFCLHVGPYEKVAGTYAKLTAFMEKNGWKPAGPGMEIYLDDPQSTAPDKLRTEIYMPVVKK